MHTVFDWDVKQLKKKEGCGRLLELVPKHNNYKMNTHCSYTQAVEHNLILKQRLTDTFKM